MALMAFMAFIAFIAFIAFAIATGRRVERTGKAEERRLRT
jgi:hypothetical protein